jgi:hypothetical protein
MPRLLSVLLLLLALAPCAWAEDGALQLSVDGKTPKLQDGLQLASDGKVWITTADLRVALDVIVKPMIPRPPQGKRSDRRRERGGWLLCGPDRCGVYHGEVLGEPNAPTFELAKAVKLLGVRHNTKKNVHSLQTSGGRWAAKEPKRARLGMLVPDVALTFLDGSTHRLRDARGKRLLLMTWASWSPSRTKLDAWRSVIAHRAGESVIVVFAALDVEGEKHVRDYAQHAGTARIAVDPYADLARAFPMTDVGRWYYVDELGVLRAEGTKANEEALAWIDLHIKEAAVTRPAPPPRRTPRVDLGVLRERVKAEPKAVAPRLALLRHLDASGQAEKLVHARALVEHHPSSAPFGFRLAALHLEAGAFATALEVLDAARRRVPGAWYLRKQYWALWKPSRYYAGAIDTAWEKAQRKLEEKEFGRIRGPGRRRKR